jgi:glucose/arabinose dehydrogenase
LLSRKDFRSAAFIAQTYFLYGIGTSDLFVVKHLHLSEQQIPAMIKNLCTLFPLLFLFSSGFGQHQIGLQLIPGSIIAPVAMANAGDGSGRLFICEQHGVVKVVRAGKISATPFLDIREKIIRQSNGYSERGLLGIAFHPRFKANGKFYVYYSAASDKKGSDHKSIIAEYAVPITDQDVADKNSERIILEVEEPESNHNGGQLAFGPDGYLYIGLGDGGGAGDKHGKQGNGQNLETLLGKIIRIDVNTPAGYRIPPDNPFAGKEGRDEIWAYGLRNPWKFSFDRVTGRLFCADVGQDKYEEVNIIRKGKNYGWRVMEGLHCYDPRTGCNTGGLELPVAEYSHSEGISVIGGYLYRGAGIVYQGKYLFADWSGKVFMLTMQTEKVWQREKLTWENVDPGVRINSMGEDEQGELYLLTQKNIGPSEKGEVYKMILK